MSEWYIITKISKQEDLYLWLFHNLYRYIKDGSQDDMQVDYPISKLIASWRNKSKCQMYNTKFLLGLQFSWFIICITFLITSSQYIPSSLPAIRDFLSMTDKKSTLPAIPFITDIKYWVKSFMINLILFFISMKCANHKSSTRLFGSVFKISYTYKN